MPVFPQNNVEVPADELNGIHRERPATHKQNIERAFLWTRHKQQIKNELNNFLLYSTMDIWANEICHLWQKACQNEEEDDKGGDHAGAHSSRVEKNWTPSYEG